MLGSDLVRYLSASFDLTPINKENYHTFIGKKFDIIIDANGNSRRFWANQNPVEDFSASTFSVVKSIFDFPNDLYIYISSADVYEDHTNPEKTKESQEINPQKLSSYGFHKYLSELIIKKHQKRFLILRFPLLLGRNIKKGPFYDITHNVPLFVTLKTKLQLITTHAAAKIIETLLKNSVENDTINVGGKGSFVFTKLARYFGKEIQVSNDAETQTYEMNTEKIKRLYPDLKTSEEYLQEFIKGI